VQHIPFNRPFFVGKEFDYIREAIACGHISGDGPFTKRCNQLLERLLGAPKVLLTTSCTHALEMASVLLNIRPGDEVIVPSFTFVSTVNAFVLRGAHPRFIDIRPDTLNMDESRLEETITPKTKAVVPVHYAGVGCEMDPILRIAQSRGLPVVEDCAHGLFGEYRGKPLGSFGSLSALSFHETKNVICGEGGALIINDPQYVERAEIIREKGTNRSRFFRGEIDKYTWVDIGSSYLPADVLAAFLYAQLEARERIQAMRKRIWNTYYDSLSSWARQTGIRLPVVPSHCAHPAHMFYLIARSLAERDAIIAHLKTLGINSVFHYVPLHLSEMGTGFGYEKGDFPVTEDLSDRLLRLPFYNELTDEDQKRIISALASFTSSP